RGDNTQPNRKIANAMTIAITRPLMSSTINLTRPPLWLLTIHSTGFHASLVECFRSSFAWLLLSTIEAVAEFRGPIAGCLSSRSARCARTVSPPCRGLVVSIYITSARCMAFGIASTQDALFHLRSMHERLRIPLEFEFAYRLIDLFGLDISQQGGQRH